MTSTGAISFRRFDAATQQNLFSITAMPGPLSLGDVSDGFVSFEASGDFVMRDVPVSTGMRSVWVAEPQSRRVLQVGPSQASARLPILALPGRVLVLWKRNDGQVVLSQFTR